MTRRTMRWAALCLVVIAAWRSMNYYSATEPGPDSSIFLSMATHASSGSVLYKDIWESKPPMIFALDAVAMAAGDNTVNSVRVMERIFAVGGVLLLFAAVFLAFASFWLAWLAGVLLLLHFYAHGIIEYGNVTEEFGAVFAIAAIAAAIASVRFSSRKAAVYAALAGVAFGAAVLSKEPFLLMIPPWAVLIAWPRGGDWKSARQRAAAFLGGAALPVLLFVVYLLLNGALSSFIGVLEYDYAYSSRAGPVRSENPLVLMIRMAKAKVFTLSLVTAIAAVFGLASATYMPFIRKTRGVPIAIAASAALALFATTLSGRYYGHYYLEFVPPYVLLAASGIAFLEYFATGRRKFFLAAVVIIAFVVVDRKSLSTFVREGAAPAARWEGSWLSALVNTYTTTDDRIWVPWNTLVYSETGRLSPTRWHFVFDYVFLDTPQSSREEQFARLRSDLFTRPPRLIIINAPPGAQLVHTYDFLDKSGLTGWIAQNYHSVSGSGGRPNHVLLLNGT